MTIIELVVAFAVLMAVLVPVSLLLTNVLSQGATSKDRLTALSLAEQCIETLNNKGPTLTDGVPEADVSILEDTNCLKSTTATVPTATRKPDVVSTISYNLYAEFRWSTEEGTHPDLCKAGLVPAVIDAQVTVTWPHTQTVTDTTLLDYPPPELPTDGFLAVQLYGTPKTDEPADAKGRSWSTRVQAVPVKITDTKATKYTHTLHPNGYGCIFVEVPPGTYTIEASDPSTDGYGTPSWVANQDEALTATQAGEVVSVGNVTGPITIPYDEGSDVTLSYPSTTATDGTVVCPSRGTILCLELGQTPLHSTTPAETPAAELSILSTTSGSKKWSISEPADVTWLTSAACAGTRVCIVVGYYSSGSSHVGVALSSGTASTPDFVADTLPSTSPPLSGITCPTTTRCYAYGLASTGAEILTGTVLSTLRVTWKLDTFTTQPARVTSMACFSKTSCYAIATKKTSTTPEILSLGSSTKWTTDTLPTKLTTTPTKLTAIACPGTKVCYAVGTMTKATSASWISLTTSTLKKWVNDTLPTTVKALERLVCPSTSVCYATGTHKTGSTVYGAIVSLVSGTWKLDTPKTDATIGAITCTPTTPTACVAIGTSSSAPIVLWESGSSTTFSSEAPSGILLLSGLACGTSTHCYIVGESSTTGAAVILSGLTTWATDALPSTPATVQISGIACGGSVCAAPGASETGAVYLDGTTTGTSWTSATPSGATGMYMSGEPVVVTNSGLETTRPLEVTVPKTTAAVASIGPLFPFQTGYSVAATVCKSMSPTVSATSVPGTTTAKVALPMGLLSVKAVNKYGNPDTGATVTAKPTCTPKFTTSSVALEPTGPLGMSQLAVTYGTYTITVETKARADSKSYTVVVGTTSLTVTGVTKPISTPIQVATLT